MRPGSRASSHASRDNIIKNGLSNVGRGSVDALQISRTLVRGGWGDSMKSHVLFVDQWLNCANHFFIHSLTLPATTT